MNEVQLRNHKIPAIDLTDLASASVSDHFLTLSRLYRYDGKQIHDFLLLDLEEAKQLQKFLNEQLKEV